MIEFSQTINDLEFWWKAMRWLWVFK